MTVQGDENHGAGVLESHRPFFLTEAIVGYPKASLDDGRLASAVEQAVMPQIWIRFEKALGEFARGNHGLKILESSDASLAAMTVNGEEVSLVRFADFDDLHVVREADHAARMDFKAVAVADHRQPGRSYRHGIGHGAPPLRWRARIAVSNPR